jgi:Flp pilus assembly protein protease CpaA
MSSVDVIPLWKLTSTVVISAAVVTEDLRHRRIPNTLCAALLIAGVLAAGLDRAWHGVAESLLGGILGSLWPDSEH